MGAAVVDVAVRKRAGDQAVVVDGGLAAGDGGAFEVGAAFDMDIEAAVSREDAGLLGDAGEIALCPAAAVVGIAGTAYPHRDRASGIFLLAVRVGVTR